MKTALLKKIQGDVACVQACARIVLYVNEKGFLLHSVCRGDPLKRHESSPWLDVFAVVGPLWDTEACCWREAIWCEIGLCRGVPYAASEKSLKGRKRISARVRPLKPTKEQVLTVFPFMLYHMEEYAKGVSGRWVSTSCYVKRARPFLSRFRKEFMHTKKGFVEKGVRFRVHQGDALLCNIVASTSLAKHLEESQKLGKLLGLCLKNVRFAQTAEDWKTVWCEDGVSLARDILENTSPYLLASALVALKHIHEHGGNGTRMPREKVNWLARVRTILSLLVVVVKKEKYLKVVRMMRTMVVCDHMPDIPHLWLLPETEGRKGTLVFELGVAREEV